MRERSKKYEELVEEKNKKKMKKKGKQKKKKEKKIDNKKKNINCTYVRPTVPTAASYLTKCSSLHSPVKTFFFGLTLATNI